VLTIDLGERVADAPGLLCVLGEQRQQVVARHERADVGSVAAHGQWRPSILTTQGS
jgi:hypothetical protein